ncbi:Crp/Fnr family transcriptional regulator [Pseudoalteromonas espejiana]
MSGLTKAQLNVITQGHWFCERDEYLKQFLLSNAKCLTLSAHQSLFLRGDKHNGIYAVLSGVMRISGVSNNGKEAVLSFIDASLWFGEVTLFDQGVRTHDVYAQTDVALCFIPQRALEQLLNQHPHYWQDFGQLLAQKLRVMFTTIEDHALLSADQRVAKRLLLLCAHLANAHGHTLNLSQQQLADMTYLTRQTANQILKKLASENLIKLGYNKVTILNPNALEQLCYL